MNTSPKPTTPILSVYAWSLSAMAGAVALAMAYGLGERVVADETLVRSILLTSLALFVLSRLVFFVPARGMGTRLRCYWVDYVLIIAAAAWWLTDRSSEPIILRLGAIYSVTMGVGALCRGGAGVLIEGLGGRVMGLAVRGLVVGAVVLVLLGGAVLALPICWQGVYPLQADHPYIKYLCGIHALECLFTATAALTGTGLAVVDIGHQLSRVGQIVVLVLMQLGGLAVLVIGSVLGWRFRHAIGWGADSDDVSSLTLRRLIRFVVVTALVIEMVGAAILFAVREPTSDYLGAGGSGVGILDHGFDSIWLSVSAFCNAGLTLSRDSLIADRQCYALLGVMLPLMVIGSVGGPVLYDGFRRWMRRNAEAISKESRVTCIVTSLLIVLGAGILYGTESTWRHQLRYPRDDTPGRLILWGDAVADDAVADDAVADDAVADDAVADDGGGAPSFASSRRVGDGLAVGAKSIPPPLLRKGWGTPTDGASTSRATSAPAVGVAPSMTQSTPPPAITFSVEDSDRVRSQRMRTMSPEQRVAAAVVHSVAARSSGMRTARLDESSMSPAGRMLLTSLMLIGGGLGGTAGGLRIVVVGLLISAIAGRSMGRNGQGASSCSAERQRGVTTAAAIAAAMFLLIFSTTFALIYRETGSPEACIFEAVSACCNVGFSTGLTSQLSVYGRVVMMLAMLLGRLIPWVILFEYLVTPTARE